MHDSAALGTQQKAHSYVLGSYGVSGFDEHKNCRYVQNLGMFFA
jgi:hypothetical protein